MAKRLDGKAENPQASPAETSMMGRKFLLGAGAAALVAGVAVSASPAKAIEPVPSLGERVNAVRTLAMANPAVTDELLRENLLTKVQWVNWPNWGSHYVPWNNWHNWHNWGNGFWGNF